MKNNISLYRKYRPSRLQDVAGQELIIKTITNALENDTLTHAYIFAGPSGVGKTSVSKILGYRLNCQNLKDKNSCGECDSCKAIKNKIGDLKEIDGATNRGIDSIKSLQEDLAFTPHFKRKVIVIDEAHMLTEPAWNALLTTIEEPPPNITFILATTDYQKIPETIRTRCTLFHFQPIDEKTIENQLKYICNEEHIKYESEKCIQLISSYSNNGLRRAINLLEQIINASENREMIQESAVKNVLFASGEKYANDIFKLLFNLNEGKICNFFSMTKIEIKEEMFDELIGTIRKYILQGNVQQNFYKVFVECMYILVEDKNKLKYNIHPKTILELAILKCVIMAKEKLNDEEQDILKKIILSDEKKEDNMEQYYSSNITINKIELFLLIIESMNSELYQMLLACEIELINFGQNVLIKTKDMNYKQNLTDILSRKRVNKIKKIICVDEIKVE